MNYRKIIDKLDFSGGPQSYFDFWHIHVDFDGEGNKNWVKRKYFLDEYLKAFDYLKTKLVAYPLSFQLWIGIDEDDSSQDGVYIHSPNPNNNYFPHIEVGDETVEFKSKELSNYILNCGLTLIKSRNLDTNYYVLFDKTFGTPLTKD